MKKVLVAAAGLMLVGTMASSAMAEFYFSGDARVRFYYQDNYGFEDETNWKSRVRFDVKADTKGGAYAVTRIKLADATWDGTKQTEDKVTLDRAYIGVPFGPVTIEGGLQQRDITNWFLLGQDVDGIDINYKTDMTTLVAFMDIEDENDNTISEDDETKYGVVLVQKFEGGWALTAGGVYWDDEIIDEDGFAGTIKLEGALGAASLAAELSYVEEDLTGTDDDGWGGYLEASMPVGPANIAGAIGFTADGFTWDAGDYGPFEMMGDVNIINVGYSPADIGETFFMYLNPTFQATEKVALGAVLAYANVDSYTSDDEYDMFEISGRVTYSVVDGAKLIGVVGYLDEDDFDGDDDEPFGVGLSMEISF